MSKDNFHSRQQVAKGDSELPNKTQWKQSLNLDI